MKVLLINGSPDINGCIVRALHEVEKVLHENGIDTEMIHVGNKDIRGCIACHYCRQHNKCVFDDLVNATAPKFAEADGIIVGTPTYYAGANGQLHGLSRPTLLQHLRLCRQDYEGGCRCSLVAQGRLDVGFR